MSKPTVSIVTPSFNQALYLSENLKSVAIQASPRYELEHLVIDGGSTDGTIELLGNTNAVTWISERDNGQSDAINKGFRMASGCIIGWLNSDDSYLPGAVEKVVKFFNENSEVGMVYGDCYVIDENGNHLYSYDTRSFDFEKLLNYGDFIPQQATFFRRNVLIDVGYLNESLHLAMDYEFWIRIAKRYRVSYLPEHLANFRRHEQTKTSRQGAAHWKEAVDVSRRHGGRRFSRLYFRHCCHRVYRVLPSNIRSMARHPVVAPAAKLIR